MTGKSTYNLLTVHSCVYFKACSRLAIGSSTAQEGSYLFFTDREIEVGLAAT